MPSLSPTSKNFLFSAMIVFTLLLTSLTAVLMPGSAEAAPNVDVPATRAGTNYYIDQVNGSDSYNGRSPTFTSGSTGPWKTLDKIDDTTSFSAGDTIHLRAGNTWDLSDCEDNYLIFRSHGTRANPITITSYGNGSKPIIDGRYPSLGSSSGDTIEIGGDYVTFDNIELKNTWSFGLVIQRVRTEHHGVVISNCYIHHTGRDGIYAPFGTYNLTITRNTIAYTGLRVGGGGIAIMGDGTLHGNDIEVSYNRVDTPQGDSITLHEGSSTKETHLGSNISIHHNVINGSLNGDGIDLTTGTDIYVYNNIVWDCHSQLVHMDSSASNVKFYNNLLYGDAGTGQAYIAISEVEFYNNIMRIDGGRAPYALNICSVNFHSLAVEEIDVYRNTFVYDTTMTHRGLVEIADENRIMGRVNFSSNVFTTDTNSVPQFFLHFQFSAFTASDNNFTCDNNVYGPGNFNIRTLNTDVNWNTWQNTYGHDTNGQRGDPGLQWNDDNTYNLKDDSICIDNSSSSHMEFRDMFGTVPYGSSDIGAIEYQPPFEMGVDRIDIGREIDLFNDGRFMYSDNNSPAGNVSMVSAPSTGFTNGNKANLISALKITHFDPTNSKVIEWDEKGTSVTRNNTYTINGLNLDERYTVEMDGSACLITESDGTGTVTFTLSRQTNDVTISLLREDKPLIIGDNLPPYIGSGEELVLSFTASDMDGVKSILFNYWTENDEMNGSMSLDFHNGTSFLGKWGSTLDIPIDYAGVLYYMMNLEDDVGTTSRSKTGSIEIVDIILPSIEADHTIVAYAGIGDIEFRFNFTDNIGLNRTILFLNISDEVNEIDLEEDENGQFIHVHQNDDPKLEEFSYYVLVEDISENIVFSQVRIITIGDISSPTILFDGSDTEAKTGSSFTFNISVLDDRALGDVWLDYRMGETEERIDGIDGVIYQDILVPMDAVGTIDYTLHAADTSGNSIIGETVSIRIIDSIAPSLVEAIYDSNTTTGEVIDVAFIILENIGIREASLTFKDSEENLIWEKQLNIFGNRINITMDVPSDLIGQFYFDLLVVDISENILSSTNNSLYISDNDPPEFDPTITRGTETEEKEFSFTTGVLDNIGVSLVFLEIIGEKEFQMTGSDNTFELVLSLEDLDLEPGTYTYVYKAVDLYGNEATSKQYALLIQKDENGTTIIEEEEEEEEEEEDPPVIVEDPEEEEEEPKVEEDEDPLPEEKPEEQVSQVQPESDGPGINMIIVVAIASVLLIVIIFAFFIGRKSISIDDLKEGIDDEGEFEVIEEPVLEEEMIEEEDGVEVDEIIEDEPPVIDVEEAPEPEEEIDLETDLQFLEPDLTPEQEIELLIDELDSMDGFI